MRALLMFLAACGRLNFESRSIDDAPPDVLDDGPSNRFCDSRPTAIYCNDFDDSSLEGADPANGTFVPGAGFGGTTGYRFVAAAGEQPRIGFDFDPNISSGFIYLSARFAITEGAPPDAFIVLGQVLSDAFADKVSFDLVAGDGAQLTNGIEGSSSSSQGGVPRGRWACFVLGVTLANVDGNLTLAIDDQVIVDNGGVGRTRPAEGFGRAELGAFSSPNNSEPIEIVFDDWVVDDGFVDCN